MACHNNIMLPLMKSTPRTNARAERLWDFPATQINFLLVLATIFSRAFVLVPDYMYVYLAHIDHKKNH